MRLAGVLVVILAFAVTAFTVSRSMLQDGKSDRASDRKDLNPGESQGGLDSFAPGATISQDVPAGREPVPRFGPIPVAVNRSPEVLDGFRGEVHPLLHGRTRLEVTAEWTPIGKGRDEIHTYLPKKFYSWFTDLRPARPRQTYTERDFSVFLPQAVGQVGQLWALDADKMAEFLRQFHPRPSMHLVAPGRRAGPDGAFAILRAISPSYLDILFRIHAEFYLTPQDGRPNPDTWYTPAFFSGRVLLNKQTGTVDHFRLGLPADKALNVHLTLEGSAIGYAIQPHEIVRVERMELAGGDSGLVDKIPWTKAMAPTEAQARLAKVFYKFLDIDWVPFDQVLTRARSHGRPIFAIVSWGATDDQSC